MENIHSNFLDAYNDLKTYTEKSPKFKDRLKWLLADMNNFIDKNELSDDVYVNETVLTYALIDYFEDVKRLKNFHGVEHINAIKIVAYTSYWLVTRKPIQILHNRAELVDINERFVFAYIIGFLNNDENKLSLLERDDPDIKAFRESLLYFLKFRFIKADTLEIMLIAFFAGQIYQNTETDISPILSKKKLNFVQD